jgi:hypothetical protein
MPLTMCSQKRFSRVVCMCHGKAENILRRIQSPLSHTKQSRRDIKKAGSG